jgi:hypothetical protein
MHSLRHRTALSTAFLTVLALILTVPFKTEILTDVTLAVGVAHR